MTLFRFRYSGPESTTESPRGVYTFAVIATWLILFVWLLGFVLFLTLSMKSGGTEGLKSLGRHWQSLPMGVLVVEIFWARQKYLGHLRITPEGLAIQQASGKRVVPYAAIAAVEVPKWFSGVWMVTFHDGSTPVAFFTGGSEVVVLGRRIRGGSKFVEALQAKLDETKGEEQSG